MKRIIAWIFAVLLCACSLPAFAQMQKVPSSRILPGLPAGMVATCTPSAGQIDILIDTDRTDWDMVASAAKKSGSIVIHPGVKRPENMTGIGSRTDYYWYSDFTAEQSEAQTYELLQQYRWGSSGNPETSKTASSMQGIAIGRYDEGTGLFIPMERTADAGDGFAVRWTDGRGGSLTECVRVRVRYTKITPIYTRRLDVQEKYIRANVNGVSGVKSTSVEDGKIVYRLENADDTREICTAVAAPSWLKVNEGWMARWNSDGKATEMTIDLDGAYGLKNSCIVIPMKIESKNRLEKRDWSVEWIDEAGKVQAVFCLQAEFHIGTAKLTVAYDTDTEPMEPDAFSWTVNHPLDGLTPGYDGKTGVLRLAIDEKKLPQNGKTDLSQTSVDVVIDVPQGAASCKVYRIQGDVIYGDSGEWQKWLETINVTPGQKLTVPELTGCAFFGMVSATLPNGKRMSYYVSPGMWGEYGGTTVILEWMSEPDGGGSRIGEKRKQITLVTDSYQLLERVSPSISGKPGELVSTPTVQCSEGGLYTAAAMLPQLGDHVVRYEIEMVDENGVKAQPQAPALVYLPYPDGKSMEDCLSDDFIVYHLLASGNYETYSLKNGRLTLTPQGLCMEVTSFSPYYLNWAEGVQSVGNVPQTGDSTNLPLLVLALVLSLLGGWTLARRRAA